MLLSQEFHPSIARVSPFGLSHEHVPDTGVLRAPAKLPVCSAALLMPKFSREAARAPVPTTAVLCAGKSKEKVGYTYQKTRPRISRLLHAESGCKAPARRKQTPAIEQAALEAESAREQTRRLNCRFPPPRKAVWSRCAPRSASWIGQEDVQCVKLEEVSVPPGGWTRTSITCALPVVNSLQRPAGNFAALSASGRRSTLM